MVKKNTFLGLPEETLIDVVATKGEKVLVKTLTIGEAKRLKKSNGWTYRNYQIGFHSFKTNI